MQKPAPLQVGDYVAIVSLSRGILGESESQHQLKLGLSRLKAIGLVPVVMPNALRGLEYLQAHPAARAADLKAAFQDDQIKAVICAIGGDDTYRLLPFLLADTEFVAAVKAHPKIFTGFSDTTINHLMFYQLGLQTFYGPNFLNDLAELGPSLLPYTAQTWQQYFNNPATTQIKSSPVWYEERTEYGEHVWNEPRVAHIEQHHYEVLRGHGQVTGRLLGGCIDSLYDLLTPYTHADEPVVAMHYQLIPPAPDWQHKILFIETSNAQPKPELFSKMLTALSHQGILAAVKGIVMGKPQNERYYEDYRQRLIDATTSLQTPILYNLNFGHAYPRTTLPYGALATMDLDAKTFVIDEPLFKR